MTTKPTLDGVQFRGYDGLECEEFIAKIRSYARSMDQSTDDAWIAKQVSACFYEDALRWHVKLEDEIRDNWRLLERALLERYPAPEERELSTITRIVPTPSASAPTAQPPAITHTGGPSTFALMSALKVGVFHTNQICDREKQQIVNTSEISMGATFVAPPPIRWGLSSLDIGKGANIRISTWPSDSTKTTFIAHINSWGDTVLHSAEFNWLALLPGALEYDCGEFATTEDHPANQPQEKTSRRIKFKRSYLTPPKVICFLRHIDMDKKSNCRIKNYTSGIDTTGFTLHVDTWGDSILYAATSGWIAYPEDRPQVVGGNANIGDIRPAHYSRSKNHKAVDFKGVEFFKPPEIFIALNYLDIGKDANLRVRCYADNISSSGFTWHIDSWADTILYRAGASYLCVT